MDIRVRNTMAAVRKSLIDLMGEEKFENITISMLCKNAGISRKTFYMHYASLDDVITDIGKDMYAQMSDRFKSKGSDYGMRDVLKDINEIISNNLDTYFKMATSESHHEFHIALEIAFQKIVADVCRNSYGLTSPNLEYYSTFFASGIISVYGKWFRSHEKQPKEKLEQILYSCTFLGSDGIIRDGIKRQNQ
ncbi:TetR family transcriptional regulator [Anaeroplasma bactoclasticum]|jgi:AcrR family transcriptional regulator|uniref:TetR family transcriptional regulator n=1 Tax=Anaeroplasma bactoclasticum TaxID=2088 RepID=A0A397RRX6_9MOLU|nr:TetR/AcrR family transcriptional regulator [Anaeroplasma bactoclasticum]RIA75942.1 TetR family transcriptional regulator [Anaeroplasma bactoclasticum]